MVDKKKDRDNESPVIITANNDNSDNAVKEELERLTKG